MADARGSDGSAREREQSSGRDAGNVGPVSSGGAYAWGHDAEALTSGDSEALSAVRPQQVNAQPGGSPAVLQLCSGPSAEVNSEADGVVARRAAPLPHGLAEKAKRRSVRSHSLLLE